MKKQNAAQRIFKTFFLGAITYATGTRRHHRRHQGPREMSRRRRQMANGTHGL